MTGRETTAKKDWPEGMFSGAPLVMPAFAQAGATAENTDRASFLSGQEQDEARRDQDTDASAGSFDLHAGHTGFRDRIFNLIRLGHAALAGDLLGRALEAADDRTIDDVCATALDAHTLMLRTGCGADAEALRSRLALWGIETVAFPAIEQEAHTPAWMQPSLQAIMRPAAFGVF